MRHPTSIIEEGAIIGNNVTIGPFCYITKYVTIEDNCVISSYVSLGTEAQSKEPMSETGKVIIGKGTLIKEFVAVSRPCKELTKIGSNCMLMSNSYVAHDCLLGDNVVLVNYSGISGYVNIGDNTNVGGYCHIHQHSKIGKYCMFGSFTFFKGESPDGITWVGSRDNKATPLKVNEIGIERANLETSHKKAIVEFAENYIKEFK